MKKLGIILAFCFFTQVNYSQQNAHSGGGLHWGLLDGGNLVSSHLEYNYFLPSGKFWSFRAGVGYNRDILNCTAGGCEYETDQYFSHFYQVTSNRSSKKNNNYFEIGGGVSFFNGNIRRYTIFYPIIGFHRHFMHGKGTFRYTFHLPLYDPGSGYFPFYIIGVSIGKNL
jgi:hypothetical protein